MTIIPACKKVLVQLQDSLSRMKDNEYTEPVNALNNSTIGQHTRHTIEFFTCLMDSYHTKMIDYDTRERNLEIESNRDVGVSELTKVLTWLDSNMSDRPLKLRINYDLDGQDSQYIESTFTRELVYNIEHAIHHMALIKVGLKEVCPHVEVDPSYGVAVSTLRHQRSLELSRDQ